MVFNFELGRGGGEAGRVGRICGVRWRDGGRSK